MAGFNILNDIMLLIIPLPFLTKLQLPRKQRIILISVFACGLLWVFSCSFLFLFFNLSHMST